MTQYGFYFDQSRCYGCRACSIACKDWNNIDPGPEKWMSVYDWETGIFPTPRHHLLAFSCGHCDKPACANACPNGAIFKDPETGAVLVDDTKCQGDRACFDACPYGSPKYASDEPGTKMTKCTMCIDRLANGEQPVCVLSCPMRALDFGPIDELIAKYGDCRVLDGMPGPEETHPNYIFTAHDEKTPLLPLDPERVRELSQPRAEGMGDVFEDMDNLVNPPEAIGIRRSLKMKNATVAEVMRATQSDLG